MQFNSNGFYWLGDSSECSSSVQLHKGALQAFTRQSATFSSQSRAHAFTCTLAFTHTWTKKKKSNFSLTMVAQRWNNQQKPHPSTHSADTYWVCVCLCNVYDCVWLCVLRDSFKTISHIYIISDLWKVAESNFIVLSGAHTYMHTNEKSFTHFP